MIELTDSQQAELDSTGRVVVAVQLNPQPLPHIDAVRDIPGTNRWWGAWKRRDDFGEYFVNPGSDYGQEWTAPAKPGDKIPTPAGSAIVRDVDVKFAERWEWVVTLELEEEK